MVKTHEAPALAERLQALDERLSQRFIALDPSGYFLIKVDHSASELVLEHYGNTIDEKGLARDDKTGEILSCKGGNGPRRPSGIYRGRTAKALAMAGEKPLLAINHLEGHALSPRLADAGLRFPYLLLLASGGHCQILEVRGVGEYRRLATTIDDALGEAFDKTAKILGLGYPGGPAVERLAREGDPRAVALPRPLKGSAEPHFSFAGLKSAVLRAHESGLHDPADLAASFQQAAMDCVIDRTARALQKAQGMTALVVAGGVAANQALRGALEALAAKHGLEFAAPPMKLCTDNAAMIAWAGQERLAAGLVEPGGDPLSIAARPRWPLDPDAETVRGAGVKA